MKSGMPSKKSKSGERAHYTAKDKQNNGSLKERLGADSQLPFGYCPLSLNPIDDPVATPSGHVYSREAMLEYLLNANREIKSQRRKFEQQQVPNFEANCGHLLFGFIAASD